MTGNRLALAHIGYLITEVTPTLRLNEQFPLLNPVDKLFVMKILDASGDGSLFFPDLDYLLIFLQCL